MIDKPKEYFKVGDIVIHQGNDQGEHIGVECTIISPLELFDIISTDGTYEVDIWSYDLDILCLDGSGEPESAQQHQLRKKQDPGELGFTELMQSLNNPVLEPA